MNFDNIKQRKQLKKVLGQLKKHDKEAIVSDQPTNILFVSNSGVLCGVTIEELEEIFYPYDPNCSFIVFPTQKSYSFVLFSSVQQAECAYKEINGTVPSSLSKSDRPFIMAFISKIPIQSCGDFVAPNGLRVVENFISQHEEEELYKITWNSNKLDILNNRRVMHFGYVFDYNTNSANDKCLEFPEICNTLIDRMISEGIISPCQRPDQITVNVYEPGQGIPPHVDTHSAFEDFILSISILADTVMEFRDCANSVSKMDVLVPRFSLLILREDARYRYKHGIPCRMYDVDPVSHRTIKRFLRISFTFRKLRFQPCQCKFMEYCDWDRNGKMSIPNDDKDGRLMEKEYVYENIANHFDETRYSQWKAIDEFLKNLQEGSFVFDAGCCDICKQLTRIANKKDCLVIRADALALPIRDSCMDAVISIAERRKQAINEIIRILRPGGKAIVTVWAMDQNLDGDSQYSKMRNNKEEDEYVNQVDDGRISVHSGKKFKQQDVFVPWQQNLEGSTQQFLRYYHVFIKDELEELIQEVARVRILNSIYEQGNWICSFEKV